MRVVVEGTLQVVPGSVRISGWTVEGDEWYPTINEGPGARALAACVLAHVARKLGVDLVEASRQAEEVGQPLPENFDAQRDALDVIAMARWREQGE